MEDGSVKVKRKSKTGPLKSTPGFLKCMRNVYLYFKEEKEKGALNIPISSFIERTAVACGVGRKTLYNYAKKGLFGEHPMMLQQKQKKKRSKKKSKSQEEVHTSKKGKKKCLSPVQRNDGTTSNSPIFKGKENPLPPGMAKNVMIQTDPRPFQNTDKNLAIQNANNDADGFSHLLVTRDESKAQQLQVVPQPKNRGTTHSLMDSWTNGSGTIKKEVDYFPKNNIWHAVYNLHTTVSTEAIDAQLATVCGED